MNRAVESMQNSTESQGTHDASPRGRAGDSREQEESKKQWLEVSKFNEKCKSAHSEISINSTQDQGREGHSQVQFSKSAEKDRFSSEQQLKISLSQRKSQKD